MSGVEVLGAVASAVTVFQVATKIWKHLDTSIQAHRDADDDVKDLQLKIHQLRICLQTVQQAGSRRHTQASVTQQDSDELQIWKTIFRTLRQCKESLERLVPGETEHSWPLFGILRGTPGERTRKITRIERQIDFHLSTLNISIISVSFIVYMAHHNEITSMVERSHTTIMERLDHSLTVGRNHLLRSTESHHVFDNLEGQNGVSSSNTSNSCWCCQMRECDAETKIALADVSLLREALDEGTTVRDRSLCNLGSESGESRLLADWQSRISENTRSPELSPQVRHTSNTSINMTANEFQQITVDASDGDLPLDPAPYFDDITPREIQEELIRRLRHQVELNYSAKQYIQAGVNQLDLIRQLEELYIGYGEEFKEFDEMQSRLADIYRLQGKSKEALELLNAGLDGRSRPGGLGVAKVPTIVDEGVMPARAGYHYQLALIRRRQFLDGSESRFLYLDAAERDAKRAFKCCFGVRESQIMTFADSVTLLIQIYEDKGKLVHAATYRDLYHPQSESFCYPPSPPSSAYSMPTSSECILPVQSAEPRPSNSDTAISVEEDELIKSYGNQERAVMDAVDRDDPKAIRKLSQAGISLDKGLLHAAGKGKVGMTQLLVSLDANKEEKGPSDATPLLMAARSNHAFVVRKLLEQGVDVNARDTNGWSVLHWAAHRRNLEVIKILLEYHVNKDAKCLVGKTTLHYLAEKNDVEVAAVLLKHGVNTQVEDACVRTPLHLAVGLKKFEFTSLLLNHGVTFEMMHLPKTSQEIRNILARAGETSTPPVRRTRSSISKSLRQTWGRFLQHQPSNQI